MPYTWTILELSGLEELPHHHRFEGGADPPRKDDERRRQSYEVVQAGEESAVPVDPFDKGCALAIGDQPNRQIAVSRLLHRPSRGALVDRLHEPPTATGDDVTAGLGQALREFLRFGIESVRLFDAAGSEDRNPKTLEVARLQPLQGFDCLPELGNRNIDDLNQVGGGLVEGTVGEATLIIAVLAHETESPSNSGSVGSSVGSSASTILSHQFPRSVAPRRRGLRPRAAIMPSSRTSMSC